MTADVLMNTVSLPVLGYRMQVSVLVFYPVDVSD